MQPPEETKLSETKEVQDFYYFQQNCEVSTHDTTFTAETPLPITVVISKYK